MKQKFVVCFSGGHSSALAAIETVRMHGRENVILLNHDISIKAEDSDIKRFKANVSDYLGLPITYANKEEYEDKHPLEVCMDIGAFKYRNGYEVCTSQLKTEPFKRYLKDNWSSKPFEPREDVKIIYGFDKREIHRIQTRTAVLLSWGYKTDYPLALWRKTISATEEIGINRPSTYETYRHANCCGCIKAGKQQWYVVYCTRPDIWILGKQAEDEIGYAIIQEGVYLRDLEPEFQRMKCKGIFPSEKMNPRKFWAMVNKVLPEQMPLFPCECAI